MLCRKQGEQFSCYEERFYSFNHTTDDGAGSVNKSRSFGVREKLILPDAKVQEEFCDSDRMVNLHDALLFFIRHDKHVIFEQVLCRS